MKKSILVLGMLSFLAVSLNSCGPSVCDCVDNAKKGTSADQSMSEKCQKKYTLIDAQEANCK
jgi:hypothetical protein